MVFEELKAFPEARMAVLKKHHELQDSGELAELIEQVQIDEFGRVVRKAGSR